MRIYLKPDAQKEAGSNSENSGATQKNGKNFFAATNGTQLELKTDVFGNYIEVYDESVLSGLLPNINQRDIKQISFNMYVKGVNINGGFYRSGSFTATIKKDYPAVDEGGYIAREIFIVAKNIKTLAKCYRKLLAGQIKPSVPTKE